MDLKIRAVKIVQAITYWPIYLFLKLVLNYRVSGQENLAGLAGKGIIFASNHTGFFDGPIVAASMPREKGEFYPKNFFPIRFLVLNKFFRWYYLLITLYVYFNGSIKIYRGTGQDFSVTLANAVRALKNGHNIWMFPEGRVTPDNLLQPGKKGAAFLHQATGVPIVPVAICGAWRMFYPKNLFRKKNVSVVLGQPIYSLGEVSLAEGTDKIMAAIAKLCGTRAPVSEEKNNKIEDFLKESAYCDFNQEAILKIAADFKNKNFSSQSELATALFYFVRDTILYRVGLWQMKASETLIEGSGTCTNKANLLIALLRACKIPAGYGVMKVKGKEYFGPVMLDLFRNHVGTSSTHIYAYVFLNGRWLKCDPSDDKIFSERTGYFNPPSQLVDWNGQVDAPLCLHPDHILSDHGPLANIDEMIAKRPRNAKGIFLTLGNLYVQFLRQNESRIDDTSKLAPMFGQWLKKQNYWYYLFFASASFLKNKPF